MNTYPNVDERNGKQFAFEVESSYIGVKAIARVLSSVTGVTDVAIRRPFATGWGENRARFKFKGRDFVVWEPHGDSSRYWIGPQREDDRIDITALEGAFRSYNPPAVIRMLADIVTLKPFRRARRRA